MIIKSKCMIADFLSKNFSLGGYYNNQYNLKLNDNEFISTLDEAEMLADYTNEEIEGTAPVLWLPWLY